MTALEKPVFAVSQRRIVNRLVDVRGDLRWRPALATATY